MKRSSEEHQGPGSRLMSVMPCGDSYRSLMLYDSLTPNNVRKINIFLQKQIYKKMKNEERMLHLSLLFWLVFDNYHCYESLTKSILELSDQQKKKKNKFIRLMYTYSEIKLLRPLPELMSTKDEKYVANHLTLFRLLY